MSEEKKGIISSGLESLGNMMPFGEADEAVSRRGPWNHVKSSKVRKRKKARRKMARMSRRKNR